MKALFTMGGFRMLAVLALITWTFDSANGQENAENARCGVSAQDDPATTSLEVRVEIDAELIDAALGPELRDAVPLANVFVYVPMIGRATMLKNLSPEKRLGIAEWLPNSEHAKQRPAVDHEFQVRDGKIVPARKIIRVNDRIKCNLAPDYYLSLELFSNSPIGAVLPDPNAFYELSRPEPVPIKVFDPLDLYVPAWVAVLDHDLARITDTQGIARFHGLPVGMDIPFHVFYPALASGRRYKFASDTTEMSGRRFVFFSADGSPQKHTIKLIRSSPK